MFDVRFHLGAGEFYKHWQVRSIKDVVYYNPKLFFFTLHDCMLKNRRGIAEKVFATQRRNVCGYIRCANYEVHPYSEYDDLSHFYGMELLYDPKIAPYWRKVDDPNSYDNLTYNKLVTFGRRIFISS